MRTLGFSSRIWDGLGLLGLVAVGALGCTKEKAEPAPAVTASAVVVPIPIPPPSAAPKASAAPSFEELVKQSTPVTAAPADYPLGKYTVKAEICAIEGGGPLGKSRSSVLPSIALQGKKLFMADADEKLRVYELTTAPQCKLTPVAAAGPSGIMTLDPKVRTVSASSALVVASSGVFGSTVLKELKPYYKCAARPQGYVAIHPSGSFGIGHFANATVAKVSFTDTTCTSAPWVFEDLSQPNRKGVLTNVNSVGFMGQTVLVGGVLAKEVDPKEPRVVLAMNQAGKELFRMGNTEKSFADDGFGWVHAVSGCSVGICVLDGNSHKLALFDAKGTFLGRVELDKLFGLGGKKAAWYSSFAVGADKALYITAGVDREGGKVAEGMVFRVTGL
jgi:hypothetical protein